MKKLNIIALALFAILVMFISGCSSGGGGFFKGGTGNIETYKFRSGSEGLSMQFVDGMPPKQIYVGTEFSTAIKVKNMGAYDIKEKADMKINIPDASAFDFKKNNPQTFTLTGKSLYVKEGEENLLMFPMKALCFPGYDGTKASIVTNYTRKIKATACYYYETTANVDLCIDTRKYLRQTGEKAECTMQDTSLSGGQGGPVGVVTISPMMIPQDTKTTTVQLGITISKLGGSDYNIYHPETGCKVEGQNNITVTVDMSGQPMQCEPKTVKLREKDSVSTICKKTMDATKGAFLTPVSVTMKYYVQQSILRDVTVEPPPGGVACSAIKGTTEKAQVVPATEKATTSADRCSTAHPGYGCREITCETGESIDACAARQGCYRGLCPGGLNTVCCK
jgi:hypothetical protein